MRAKQYIILLICIHTYICENCIEMHLKKSAFLTDRLTWMKTYLTQLNYFLGNIKYRICCYLIKKPATNMVLYCAACFNKV